MAWEEEEVEYLIVEDRCLRGGQWWLAEMVPTG